MKFQAEIELILGNKYLGIAYLTCKFNIIMFHF